MPSFAEPVRPTAQSKSEGAAPALTRRPVAEAAPAAAPASLPEPLKSGAEALGGFSLADVRVHRDSPEPARLGALAFARGGDIHLGPGQEGHLPHEAWHVVQQKQGRVAATTQLDGAVVNEDASLETEADRMAGAAMTGSDRGASESLQLRHREPTARTALSVVQRRRIPEKKVLAQALPHENSQDPRQLHLPAFAGMARVLSRAWGDLAFRTSVAVPSATTLTQSTFGPTLQNNVRADMFSMLVWTDEANLLAQLSVAPRDVLVAMANSLRRNGALTLGDPQGMEVKADLPAEKDKLTQLVASANQIFDLIAAGNFNAGLSQVFGNNNVPAAVASYAKGKAALNKIVTAHVTARSSKTYTKQSQKIPENETGVFTDRSGYYEEVRKAGQAGTSDRLFLFLGFIENPTSVEATLTAIHEGVHAGNSEVEDKGYLGSSGFNSLSPADRLKNAAHYEVIPKQFLETGNGNVTPNAGSAAASTTTPAAQQQASALRLASEKFRQAWTAAMRFHELLVPLYLNPAKWTKTHAEKLPYWSSLAQLTIHGRRPDENPGTAATNKGVTIIDLALSEGLVRKLAVGMAATGRVGATVAGTQYLTGEATDVPLRNRIISDVLSNYCGAITGPTFRDLCVVVRLAQAEAYKNDDEFLANGGSDPFVATPAIANSD